MSKDMGRRIRNRREELGLTQEDLAKRLGYKSKSTVNKIELGINDITQRKIAAFAKALNCSPSYIMGWSEDIKGMIPMSEFHTIPLYSEIAGGKPIEMNNTIIDNIPVTGIPDNGEYFALKIKGHSMEPKILDGDIVVVHAQNDAENGEIVIISIDGKNATCKRLYKYADHLSLLSFNPEYEPMDFTAEEVKNKPVCIYGKVKQLIRYM